MVVAFLFSSYMVFYTLEAKRPSFRLSVIFPRGGYSPSDNVDALLTAIGDGVSSFRGVVDRGGCRVFSYLTEKMGRASAVYCSGEDVANVIAYVNEAGLPFGRAGINGMDVAQEIILHLAYAGERARTGFVIYYSGRAGNLTSVKVSQLIKGLEVLGSGFELVVDEKGRRIHELTVYRIYGVDEEMNPPKPSYEKLYRLLRYINIQSREFDLRGLIVCGEEAFFIEVEEIALALTSVDTGDVLGLYVFDEEGGREVVAPEGCAVDWLGLP